nr:MAG TPA_asm: hypothetical protein [Caudoviricetes sp.]
MATISGKTLWLPFLFEVASLSGAVFLLAAQ